MVGISSDIGVDSTAETTPLKGLCSFVGEGTFYISVYATAELSYEICFDSICELSHSFR